MVHHRSDPARRDPEKAQARAIALLSDPATHGGVRVERIDTHISHVFVAGPRTYKLKRAIRRSFLDYSTPGLRREACEREAEINRLAAPGMYLGCRAIAEGPRGLALGGEGEPVDWVVEMVTFDRQDAFDRMAESERLTPAHMTALADIVAGLHDRAPRAPEFGGAEAVGGTIRQIAGSIAEATGTEAVARAALAWRAAAEPVLAAHAARLDARRRHGLVRRCHGDLHLGNICMFHGRPTPFDAIEFSEEIASTDVLHDIAFTVMDLLHRDEPALAGVLANRYLARTRDYRGLGLMPLFVSMRAAVRAIPLASQRTPAGDDEAADVLHFATAALAAAPAPLLVAVGGLSGAGKSTLAAALAPALGPGIGAVVLRSDVTRKLMAGVVPEERLPAGAYTPEASRRVHRRMRRDAARALAAGQPVILDATFLEADARAAARRLADRAGAAFAGLWLCGSACQLAERLDRRGRDASDATAALVARQEREGALGDWIEIGADDPPERVAAAARRALSGHGHVLFPRLP